MDHTPSQEPKPSIHSQDLPLIPLASSSATRCLTNITTLTTNHGGASAHGDASTPSQLVRPTPSWITLDDYNLMSLGYKPVMSRSLSSVILSGISVTSSNVLCGIIALYGLPLTNGGPAWVTWSYLVVGIMSCAVSFCLAELSSAYPTTAGVHHWVYQLAPSSWKPFMTWMTGWLAVLGAVASASSIAFYFSSILGQVLYTIHRVALTPGMLVMFHLGAVIFWQILNLLPVRGFGYISTFSGACVVGVSVTASIILLMWSLPEDASMIYVPFTAFLNYSGNSSSLYAGLSSALMAAFVFCPQDSIIRMSEETRRPEHTIPKLIPCLSVGNLALGLPLIIGLDYGILQPMKGLLDEAVLAVRVIVVTLGKPLGAIFISLILMAIFFTGLVRLSMATRVAYAFSRDAGLPKSSYWNHLHAQRRTPHRVSWLVTVACMSGIFPFYWGDNNAFHWIASLACIATNLSFVIPLWLMLTRAGTLNHRHGPFRIRVLSRSLYTISILWLISISAILMLPSTFPLTRGNFNYASAATVGILAIVMISWPKAKYHFTGTADVGSQAAHRISIHSHRRFSQPGHQQHLQHLHSHSQYPSHSNKYQRHRPTNQVSPLEDRQLTSSTRSPSFTRSHKSSSLQSPSATVLGRAHMQGQDQQNPMDRPWSARDRKRKYSQRTLGSDFSITGHPLHKGQPISTLDIPPSNSPKTLLRDMRNTMCLSASSLPRPPSEKSLCLSEAASSYLLGSGGLRLISNPGIPEISVAPPTTSGSSDSQGTGPRPLSQDTATILASDGGDHGNSDIDSTKASPMHARPPNATESIFLSPTGSSSCKRLRERDDHDYFGDLQSHNAIHNEGCSQSSSENRSQDIQILKPNRPPLERRHASLSNPRHSSVLDRMDDNDSAGQQEDDGKLRFMDLKVDDSFGEEYLHQYPVISTFQSTHSLFKVPLSTIQGSSVLRSLLIDRSAASRDAGYAAEERSQAIAQWAHEQNKIHERRMDKKRARALNEIQAPCVDESVAAIEAGAYHSGSVITRHMLQGAHRRTDDQDASQAFGNECREP
ncbi:amino acid permease-domain-containing protein [Mortierella sp. GBAus27b]|nr:amino acid permease-domain-containing protein [Mortierella sp. GBAus27b]